jgi:aspartate/methionine/tyrosine aminotransferase
MFLSDRSRFAGNPLEEEDLVAIELEKKGMKIVRLNRGDPPKYFPTPRYIIDAYIEALRLGKTSYSKADGDDMLKEAIMRRYKRKYGLDVDGRDITVTTGISEALSFLNSALINDGDIGVLFRPSYTIYTPLLRLCGGRPLMARYDEKDGWSVHIDVLRRLLKGAASSGLERRIKYMMLTNPNNPTGTVLKRSDLEEVVDIANEHGIMLISDEIYDEIVYNGARFTSISEVAKGMPHVVLNGASKVFDSTGFRIGFAIIPEDDKRSESLKRKLYDYAIMRLSVNTPAQYAVAAALNNVREHNKAIRQMVKGIEDRTNHATKMFKENQYLDVVEPNGAFYVFPRIDLKRLRFKDDREFVDMLLRKTGVQVTRGSGFNEPSHFRIVALPPKEILDYAIDKINAFCRSNSR